MGDRLDGEEAETMDAITIAEGGVTLAKLERSRPDYIGAPEEELVLLPTEYRFERIRQLGEGGMGTVHLCRDLVIGRDVAMKVVAVGHTVEGGASHEKSRDIRRRFVREARVQGQLEHPAIVPVYDVGLEAPDQPFFTMRRVRGITLEEILVALRAKDAAMEKRYTRHQLLAAFERVCLAVAYAHERGVVHRDLKPANVMLGAHGEVYVLDWGLAKLSATTSSQEVFIVRPDPAPPEPEHVDKGSESGLRVPVPGHDSETKHGAVLGTPQYMAPEQIRGEAVDARTDIYALGAILFEVLTLEPLQGAGTVPRIFQRALAGADARASVRAPDRDVPPELEQACVRATALDPLDRHPSARDLADGIEAYLSGDRDLELRRSLAAAHVARAREAASSETTLAGRATALREVGRALALDPDDGKALALLVGFLTAPPARTPPEVVAAIASDARTSQRNMLPRGARSYAFAGGVFAAAAMVFEVRDVRMVLAPIGLVLLAALLAIVTLRYGPKEEERFTWVAVTAGLALAASSLFYGPLFVVPAAAAVVAMAMTVQRPASSRPFATGVCVLATTLPMILAWLGVHPAHHAFPGGALEVTGTGLAFSRGTLVFLGLLHAGLILVGVRYTAAYRDELHALQTRMRVQAWQLERLVPGAAGPTDRPSVTQERRET